MKTFVMLPTYNESLNIRPLIEKIFLVAPDCEVVVVDDNSPDGTWKIVEELKAQNPKVHLVHRTQNRGRGISGIAGFLYALKNGADAVVEMDADFSHNPDYIPIFLRLIQDFDIVSGSRYVQGGQDADRGAVRQLITFFASLYIRWTLGLKLRDCSSGFRCYRREVLQNIGLENMVSTGPSIVQECLLRACQLGYRIIEVPITFVDRKMGQTKLTYKHLIAGFLMVLRLRLKKRYQVSVPLNRSASSRV